MTKPNDLIERVSTILGDLISEFASGAHVPDGDLMETAEGIIAICNEAQAAEIKRLQGALENAGRTIRNVRGQIESNQTMDKDTVGTCLQAEDAVKQALSDSPAPSDGYSLKCPECGEGSADWSMGEPCHHCGYDTPPASEGE